MEFFKQFFGDVVLTPQLIDVTYVWRVENYVTIPLDEMQVSDIFAVGKNSYTLELTKSSPEKCLSVKLVQVKPREPASKFLCSAGLVGSHGKLRHFVRKEPQLGKCCETKELLNIPLDVLHEEKSDLIHEGTLSVQLTINLPTEHEWLTPCDPCERGLASLSRDIGKLLDDKTGSDVVLKVGDTVFKAHSLILSARSPVFAQMFDLNASYSSSAKRDTFDITDVDSSIFGHVLRYIYKDQVGGALTLATAPKFIEAAERYRLHALKRSCVSFLATNLAIENVCEAILLANKSVNKLFKDIVDEFVSKNFSEITRSEQWKKFRTENRTVVFPIVKRYLRSRLGRQPACKKGRHGVKYTH